jgi:hypothetical protein
MPPKKTTSPYMDLYLSFLDEGLGQLKGERKQLIQITARTRAKVKRR